MTREYEVHVSASYITEGQTKAWTYFREYVVAASEKEAKAICRDMLRAEGYKNISMEAIEA